MNNNEQPSNTQNTPEETSSTPEQHAQKRGKLKDRMGFGRTAKDVPDAASLLQDLQRTRADFENFRKQVDIQREQAKSLARNATVLKLLPLLDDMDRAISAYPDQLSSLAKSFEKTLKELNLQKIDSTPGVDFNPDFHDAISMDDSDGSREVIAETLRSGYLYEGEVIRPAMVRVTHSSE